MSQRTIISTDDAPAAIGPYSQAVKANGMLFCSGQIPLNAAGEMVGGDDVAAQAEQCMKNLGAVLAAGGSGWDKALKCTIFLADMGDFAAVNEVYGSYFEGMDPPARATVAVKTLPKDVKVEIDVVALAD